MVKRCPNCELIGKSNSMVGELTEVLFGLLEDDKFDSYPTDITYLRLHSLPIQIINRFKALKDHNSRTVSY